MQAAIDVSIMKSARRRFSFSSRALLLCIALLCGALALAANRSHQRRIVIGRLEPAFGYLLFDYQVDPRDTDYFAVPTSDRTSIKPPAPNWLRWLAGDEFFGQPLFVVFETCSDDASSTRRSKYREAFTAIGSLPTIQGVQVNGCDISIFGIAWTKQIASVQIADDCIRELKNLPEIRILELGRTEISDEALRVVGQLSRLQYLSLDFTRISDAGIKHLASLNNLRGLSLEGTDVTDEVLQTLKELPRLTYVQCSRTRITDRARQEFWNSKGYQRDPAMHF